MSEITVETLNPLHVAAFKGVSPTPEDDVSAFVQAWYNRQGLPGRMHNFGFDVPVSKDEEQAGKRGYQIWAVVPEGTQPSEGVAIQDYKGGLYATLTLEKPFTDPFKFIPAGWKTLHEWVITGSAYRGHEHQWLEELIPHEDGDDLKLYYPVSPA
jgi:hypothetical protein